MSDTICTHQVAPGRWVVSENDQWLPGAYDSDETARLAARYPDEVLIGLGHIYRVEGENRPVTRADLPTWPRSTTSDPL